MNKLTALSKLAGAFHYIGDTYRAGKNSPDALHILADKFGYIRRSLRIEDLAPTPKSTEGFNGRMPQYF